MAPTMGVLIRTLAWHLVLQAIVPTGESAGEVKEVEFEIMIRNEMYGVKGPTVFYWCRSPKKDYGWHKSFISAEFSWDFTVPPFGNGAVVHECEFRSSEGTARIKIETWSTTSMLCDGHQCVYAVRPDGIYFIGYELYYPSNFLGRFFEMLRPVEKLVEPWMAWSPRQLDEMRRRRQQRRAKRESPQPPPEEDDDDDHDEESQDDDDDDDEPHD